MQSNKDSKGGKSHPANHSSGNKAGGTKDKNKKSSGSPVGVQNTGEKKTTPH